MDHDAYEFAQHLRDLRIRLERQERHTHVHVAQPPVVTVITPEPEPGCVPWSDDFERADGPLGSNWLPCTYVADYIDAPQPLTIVGGAAVATADTHSGAPGSYTECLAKWNDPQGDDQAVEVTVDTFFTTDGDVYSGGWVQLYLQAHDQPADHGAATCIFSHSVGEDYVSILVETIYASGGHSGLDAFAEVVRGFSEPVVFGFECDVDGTRRAYVDGTLALTVAPDPSFTPGPWAVIATDWPESDPKCRILSATGGCPSEPSPALSARTAATSYSPERPRGWRRPHQVES